VSESLDESGCVVAKHQGFRDEELGFIINYNIKSRLGRGSKDQ